MVLYSDVSEWEEFPEPSSKGRWCETDPMESLNRQGIILPGLFSERRGGSDNLEEILVKEDQKGGIQTSQRWSVLTSPAAAEGRSIAIHCLAPSNVSSEMTLVILQERPPDGGNRPIAETRRVACQMRPRMLGVGSFPHRVHCPRGGQHRTGRCREEGERTQDKLCASLRAGECKYHTLVPDGGLLGCWGNRCCPIVVGGEFRSGNAGAGVGRGGGGWWGSAVVASKSRRPDAAVDGMDGWMDVDDLFFRSVVFLFLPLCLSACLFWVMPGTFSPSHTSALCRLQALSADPRIQSRDADPTGGLPSGTFAKLAKVLLW